MISTLLPAIAHLDTSRGHSVVLLKVVDNFVSAVDMLSGRVEREPRDRFLGRWSGYLLVSATTSTRFVVGWLPVGLRVAAFSLALVAMFLKLSAPNHVESNP